MKINYTEDNKLGIWKSEFIEHISMKKKLI